MKKTFSLEKYKKGGYFINKFTLDILKEVTNIASGNAISALASFTDKELDIYIPSIQKIHFRDLSSFLGNEEDIIVAINQNVLSGFEGEILFVLDECSFKNIVFEVIQKYGLLDYKSSNDIDIYDLSSLEVSTVQEIGNILTGSYLSAISELIGQEVNPSSPIISVDMAASILSHLYSLYPVFSDYIFFVNTKLSLDNINMNSMVFLIPKKDGFDNLIKLIQDRYNIYE